MYETFSTPDAIDASNTSTLISLRLALLSNGYWPVPVLSPDVLYGRPGKGTTVTEWQTRCAVADATAVERMVHEFPDHTNTGMLCGPTVGVDIDVLDAGLAQQIETLARVMLGDTPLRRIGKAPKVLLCYRNETPIGKSATPEMFLADGSKAQVEIMGAGQQVVAYGVHPDTRKPYMWPEKAPHEVPLADLPAVTPDALDAFLKAAEGVLHRAGATEREKPERASAPAGEPRGETFWTRVNSAALANIEAWAPDAVPGGRWCSGAYRVSSAVLGRDLEEDLSIHPDGIRDFGTEKSMSAIDVVQRHVEGAGNLKEAAQWLCEKLGVDPDQFRTFKSRIDPREAFGGVRVPPLDRENSGQGVAAQPYSDDALAQVFSARHADDMLYVNAWGTWLKNNGARWKEDNTLAVFDMVRNICREAATRANEDTSSANIARTLNSAQTVSSVERMARWDLRHARAPEDFDSNPFELNSPSGVVDLRTGYLRPHRPGDMHTKIAGATPGGDCRRWLAFLDQITQGNADLVAFLKRFAGYTLTGSTQDHAFLFAHGPGGNGKGVLFGALQAALGDYATTAAPEVFTASTHDQHPAGLAALRGARMVAVTEVEEGRRWAEARIKAFTGGDRVSARVMRGDPFEFIPVCKLWFSGNHQTPLRNPDAAMRRRMHMVPLTYIPATPDPGLADALRAELPGILAWAVQGCLEWQRLGLVPPAVVQEATEAYFAEQDSQGQWFAENVERVPGAQTPSRALFRDWSEWAKRAGEEPGTEKRFSETLQRRAPKRITNKGKVFDGVRLRAGQVLTDFGPIIPEDQAAPTTG